MNISVLVIPEAEYCERVTAFVWAVMDSEGRKLCVVAETAEDAASIARGRTVEGPTLTVRRATPQDVDTADFAEISAT